MPKNFALLRLLVDPKSSASDLRPQAALSSAYEVCAAKLNARRVVFQIADLFSVISVLLGVLLGMCVFVPLCCLYLALGWSIAALTFMAFSILSTAAIGFAAAGLFSLLSLRVLKFLKILH